MPLESGDFISDLVETNPPGTDNVSQGDDHLRLIKHVLKTQFPNLTCAVTATCEDLNNAGKSQMPIVTTYATPAAAQTHTFTAGRSWYRVIVTGGGGGGNGTGPYGSGGGSGATAIKTEAITEADATFTVGAGGIESGAGEDSTFSQGANPVITAGGGIAGAGEGSAIPSAVATNGDVNINGSGGMLANNQAGAGGPSYWGGASYYLPSYTNTGAYGSGGFAAGSGDGCPGYSGVIYIEEY